MSNNTLTIESLRKAAELMPRVKIFNYCTVIRQVRKELENHFPEMHSHADSLYRMEIVTVEQQKAQAWFFTDYRIMRKYLNGKLTETELLEIEKTSGEVKGIA